MKKELKLVEEFHNKFNAQINNNPTLIDTTRFHLRYKLMNEEVNEYLEGAKKKDLENIAQELADILYTTYGTIIEHGLQHKIEAIFKEVHLSNMSKEYHPLKAKKGKHFTQPNISKILNPLDT